MNGANGKSSTSFRIVKPPPKNGQFYIGCLVGGYKDTRAAIGIELEKRYGIKPIYNFGLEKRQDRNIFVPSNTEICVLLADDLKDMLDRVLKACKAAGVEHVGINRKQHTWDPVFLAEGYSNPPKWRQGFEAGFAAKLERAEEERKAELKDIEERPTRTAYVDPALRNPAVTGPLAKLGDVVVAKPEKVAAVLEAVVGKPAAKSAVVSSVLVPSSQAKAKAKPAPATVSRAAFGAFLLDARHARGISQREMAEGMTVDQSMLSSYEKGKTIPLYPLWLRMRDVVPGLPAPEGMKGQKAYEAEHGPAPEPKASPKPAPSSPPADATPPAEIHVEPKPGVQMFASDPAPPPPPVERPAPPVAAPAQPPPVVAQPAPPPAAPPVAHASSPTEQITIKLRSGGTLSLAADVNLFKLRGEDRAFVFELIDKLQAYEEGK